MKRRVTGLLLLSVGLLLSTVKILAQDNQAVEKDLQAKEQAAWQAWKDKNQKAFDPILTDDAVNIAGGGMQKGKQNILKDLNECSVSSFALSDFSFLWIDKDAVVITYKATQDGSCGGQKLPPKVIASSVWHKRGNVWVSPFHQESTAEGM